MQYIIILIVMMSMLRSALGCSCLPNKRPLSESFASATAVFIGRATEVTVDQTTRQRRVLFQASEVFKGARCNHKKFVVFTNLDSAACGLGINQGDQWQIWATGTKDRLQAFLCGESTRSINSNIEFLRQQRKP